MIIKCYKGLSQRQVRTMSPLHSSSHWWLSRNVKLPVWRWQWQLTNCLDENAALKIVAPVERARKSLARGSKEKRKWTKKRGGHSPQRRNVIVGAEKKRKSPIEWAKWLLSGSAPLTFILMAFNCTNKLWSSFSLRGRGTWDEHEDDERHYVHPLEGGEGEKKKFIWLISHFQRLW